MNPLFLLSGLGMMAVALVVVIDWKLHYRIPWSLFLWGALAWTISVALKSVAAIPTETIMESVRGAPARFDFIQHYFNGLADP